MRLDGDGAELAGDHLTADELGALETLFADLGERPGRRVTDHPVARALTAPSSTLGRLATAYLGPAARPVRALLFDKRRARNWAVAWHQDRTIAVERRVDTPGFGPWSRKAGVQHVEPPFDLLSGMLTVRAHLDDCDADNAPLVVARGSHRIGLIPADRAAGAAQGFEPATCLAEPGQIWLYATPILHTSAPARRPRRRRVLQVDFAAVDLPGALAWAGV